MNVAREIRAIRQLLARAAFNRSGIRVSANTEVVEEEEIEPQGSTPVKERRKRAE
jgi:hypothetical protein